MVRVNLTSIACTALVQSYPGMVVCRFLLGITEAPVSVHTRTGRCCAFLTVSRLVLSRSDIYLIHLLYPKRSCRSNRHVICSPDSGNWVRWVDCCRCLLWSRPSKGIVRMAMVWQS
ncbi:hypothetical protein H106_03137 [Trichophyton rubrum CBS 735.88]|nr:hypothetical protein H106_03137 [Trichophyton rubrum CBS 735.88]